MKTFSHTAARPAALRSASRASTGTQDAHGGFSKVIGPSKSAFTGSPGILFSQQAPRHPTSAARGRNPVPAQAAYVPRVAATAPAADQETVVVIGNGMVGLRFCEKMVELDTNATHKIVTFCEEDRPAYHRMNMTQYFGHRDPEQLELAPPSWYSDSNVDLYVGDKAVRIDRERKVVVSEQGREIPYDKVVVATGSSAFIPPIPNVEAEGVFAYRTLNDLDAIINYSKSGAKVCAVLGGGLLGLEAAKAAYDLGMEVHVIEFAPRLMPRQIDDSGSEILASQIEALGLKCHLGCATEEVVMDASGKVTGLRIKGMDEPLPIDMLIVSAGIRPRDELARDAGLDVGARGGITVDAACATSDPSIFSIGEACAHTHSKYGSMVYGLVAPGYEMAEVVAENLLGGARLFPEADMSTKLKLMGVDVASFGDYEFADDADVVALTQKDAFGGVYKKLFFSPDGKKLLGGMLVGDASDYTVLAGMAKGGADLTCEPRDLIFGSSDGGAVGDADSLGDDFQVCSCNNVTKGDIIGAINDEGLGSIPEVKACTQAGTGCGGCNPLVADIFNAEMKAQGREVKKVICEHFPATRQELYHIAKVEGINTFQDLLAHSGTGGSGCEICKPLAASIFASIQADFVLKEEHLPLQNTNDRFLANIQRGGTYSVVPRIPGGEITPKKLAVIARVAEDYGLYTKITGGQRIDLFGARKQDLPKIWSELVAAGFESGHAYGKALRTVKSCVGSSWCRYGLRNSVEFAVEVEERYKGIRAPHKIKSAVSGCIRECAEAQSKDFAYIATETGYNVYVCGNGGSYPRHADLLAAGVDEEEAIRLTDRFLMFYIETAAPLQRTAPWLDEMEGGIEYLKDVVVNDTLGICDRLESDMQALVDRYECEWKAVVEDPEKQKLFTQFVNDEEGREEGIEFVDMRGQLRPADWPKGNATESITGLSDDGATWVKLARAEDVPKNSGAAVKYGDVQLSVVNFHDRGEWYCIHNMCPHKASFVMDQGILGTKGDEPKIACPVHMKNYSLKDGSNLQGEDAFSIPTFPAKVEDGDVYAFLPPTAYLNAKLATDLFRVKAEGGCGGDCDHGAEAAAATPVIFGEDVDTVPVTPAAAPEAPERKGGIRGFFSGLLK